MFVFGFRQHLQYRGIAGGLPVAFDFVQRIADEGVEPVQDGGGTGEVTGDQVFMFKMLQFMQQHEAHAGSVIIGQRVKRQVNARFQEAGGGGTRQICGTVNRDFRADAHFM